MYLACSAAGGGGGGGGGGQLEVGCGLGADKRYSRPADILVQNWIIGKPAAFDLTVTSPLNLTTLTEARELQEGRQLYIWQLKFRSMMPVNDRKCAELGWVAIPLAVRGGYRNFLRGGARLIKVTRKWAWIPRRGWVREGDMPPPARSAEAFDTI